MSSVFVLGPEGSNGHAVARHHFGERSDIKIVFCTTNANVLEEVENTPNSYGVAPVENVCAGFVTDVIHFWLQGAHATRIVAEYWLPVTHTLMVHPRYNTAIPVRQVCSHEQALAQCASTLSRLKISERKKMSSTSAAAQYVRDHPDESIAAVAAPLALEVYGLKALKENVADSEFNSTRFHIVAQGMPLPAPTDCDRTALLFELVNHPGALYDVLTPLKKLKVNASAIHSIPLGRADAHAFYMEVDAHQADRDGKQILSGFRELTTRLDVLGSFPRANNEGVRS